MSRDVRRRCQIIGEFMADGWLKFIGKNVTLVFDDSSGRESFRRCFLEDLDDKYATIRTDGKSSEAIPKERIIRIEIMR
jgi:hypothetical protein